MIRVFLILAVWVAFVNIVYRNRDSSDTYDQTILSAVTAESVRSSCADTEIDPEAFKQFLNAASLGHAEVYQLRRSHRLQELIDDLKGRLRSDWNAECKRIRAAYGPESASTPLLRSRGGILSWHKPSLNMRLERLRYAFTEWLTVPSATWAEMPRGAITPLRTRGGLPPSASITIDSQHRIPIALREGWRMHSLAIEHALPNWALMQGHDVTGGWGCRAEDRRSLSGIERTITRRPS